MSYIVSTMRAANQSVSQSPSVSQSKEKRLNLRATARQEMLIRAGARVRGVNITDFILESACVRAEQVIADQTTFALSPQKWKEFCDALDRPPLVHPKPRLKRLLSEPSVAVSR